MNHQGLLQAQIHNDLKSSSSPELGPLSHAVSEIYDRFDIEREHAISVEQSIKALQQQNHELKTELQELHSTKRALQASYSLLQASLSSTSDGLVVLDSQGSIRLTNQNFNHLFRLDTSSVELATIEDLINHCRDLIVKPEAFAAALRHSIRLPEREIKYELCTIDGHWIEAKGKAQWQEHEVVGQVWSFNDITDLKLKEREALHRTHHDFLTGLPNRRSLLQRLRKHLSKAESSGTDVQLLFIDLNGFKDVNDSLGHSVGDSLLIEVARRIEDLLPEKSILTRHGGDEFIAILYDQRDLAAAKDYSQKIIECVKQPYHIGHQDIYMSACIGIASRLLHGGDTDRLISCANLAMTQSKLQGENAYLVFDANKTLQCERRLSLRNEINIALEQDQFELVFQPKICLDSGSIKGAEALIRWRMPDGSMRNPMEFIPAAEESGQIIPITQWVMKRCCEMLESWMPHLDPDFVLAMNISARHFQKGLLQEHVATVLQDIDVVPSMLELEVTETAIMDDIDLAVRTLEELKKLGIRTAIDDFGTGYSSLNYLRKLPIEVLKIDKCFIDEIIESAEDRTLVRGIIDMVHALGIEVVAEGVENHQMAVLLQSMNCDLVQGFHYCKPISATDFINLIKDSQCYI